MTAAVDEALVAKVVAVLEDAANAGVGLGCVGPTTHGVATAVLAAVLPDAQAKAWDRGASEGLRTPPRLGYMLRNPYRDAAHPRSP